MNASEPELACKSASVHLWHIVCCANQHNCMAWSRPVSDVTGVHTAPQGNKADLLLELLSVGGPSHGAQLERGVAGVVQALQLLLLVPLLGCLNCALLLGGSLVGAWGGL